MDQIALHVGQMFCDLAAAVMYGQFRCRDPAALLMVGYILMAVAIVVGAWLAIVRPRLK
jgi:hypothetical protein